MDYTTQPLGFKIKKTLRYVRLFGVKRTLMKVKGQYHMKKAYESLPDLSTANDHNGRIGLIGCGNYAFSNIAYYLDKKSKGAMRACMDKDIAKAASLYESFGLHYFTGYRRFIAPLPVTKSEYAPA